MCKRVDGLLSYEIISLFKKQYNLCQLTQERPWLSLYTQLLWLTRNINEKLSYL